MVETMQTATAAGTRALDWSLLAVAGVLEVAWLVLLKQSEGFARPAFGIASMVLAWASFFLLSFALRSIPAGTAYAVWTGVGAAGGAIAGVLLFGESRDALRTISIALIVAGIVGVKLGGACVAAPPAGDMGATATDRARG
ncbi:MAG: hypothetical protein AMXMBFR72_09990 [Betaproteobacteria bacterium]